MNKKTQDFLDKTNTAISIEFVGYKSHFIGEKTKRDVYKVTFTRGERSFYVMFGQSINASGKYIIKDPYIKNIFGNDENVTNDDLIYRRGQMNIFSGYNGAVIKNKNYAIPTPYDVLSTLQKYDVGTFKDFCDCFGYNDDSIIAHKTYIMVVKEYKNVCMLWNEKELNILREVE
jgi:hypothetical protein